MRAGAHPRRANVRGDEARRQAEETHRKKSGGDGGGEGSHRGVEHVQIFRHARAQRVAQQRPAREQRGQAIQSHHRRGTKKRHAERVAEICGIHSAPRRDASRAKGPLQEKPGKPQQEDGARQVDRRNKNHGDEENDVEGCERPGRRVIQEKLRRPIDVDRNRPPAASKSTVSRARATERAPRPDFSGCGKKSPARR